MYNELSDNQLIALHKANDTEAFPVLLERYKDLVRGVSRAYYLVGGDGDDVLQEGYCGLLKAVTTYSENSAASFSTFARLCIESAIKTAVTKANNKGNELLNNAVSLAECLGVFAPDTPEDKVIDDESVSELRERITSGLSETEKTVLERYLTGMTYGEIADAIGCNEKKVDNAIQRIKKKLLKKRG